MNAWRQFGQGTAGLGRQFGHLARFSGHQLDCFLNGACQLGIVAIAIILRRYVYFDIRFSPIVLHFPANILKPMAIFGLCRHRAIHQSVPWRNADHATPSALADERPNFSILKL